LLGRIVRLELYQITQHDIWTFATSILSLIAVAICAAAIPIRRATRLDPVVSLRAD
jgi:ABC-type antimicrobial peptide transport system permease subunit